MNKAILFKAFILLLVASCKTEASENENKNQPVALSINSNAFNHGDSMPYIYTCLNPSQVFPHLSWSGGSSAIKSYCLILDDPDAIPVVGYVWNHWVIYDIPDSIHSILKGISNKANLPLGAIPGTNSFSDTTYGGPCPPTGQLHHYYFRLYGLTTASLMIGRSATVAQVRQAMAGKISDSAVLMGTFRR